MRALFSLPMLPEAVAICMPWLLWLSVIGIIYGALVALAQTDMKRLIAYSSNRYSLSDLLYGYYFAKDI